MEFIIQDSISRSHSHSPKSEFTMEFKSPSAEMPVLIVEQVLLKIIFLVCGEGGGGDTQRIKSSHFWMN